MNKQIKKILIANRGEIACRVINTAQQMGISTVAVYSDADKHAMHVNAADEAYNIGPAPVTESYLRGDKIMDVAKKAKVDAIHPGYGFLSENADFADLCQQNGIKFIGPSAQSIKDMGLKGAAKNLMIGAGVPVVPGYHGENQDAGFLQTEANKIGYPLLIKAVAGGGGKGMRLVENEDDFAAALNSAAREGETSFGNGIVLLEKYITTPRHIEIQVFGDSYGDAVYLFERDCSLQRRHQKVVEEAPAPHMPENVRKAMGDAAVRAAKAISYEGAGTIEFIVDAAGELTEDSFYFMEMNTRLQVEHPVTEAITGEDLVAWQIKVAQGEPLPKTQDELTINGHSLEVRLYAEDPESGFLPQTGMVNYFSYDYGSRLDTGICEGSEVSPFYDPMIAKIITHGESRDEAIEKMENALNNTALAGVKTNLAFLANCVSHAEFKAGNVETGFIEKYSDDLIPAKPNRDKLAELAILAVFAHTYNRNEIYDQFGYEKNSDKDIWAQHNHWRMGQGYDEIIHLTHESGENFIARYKVDADTVIVVEGLEKQINGQKFDDDVFVINFDDKSHEMHFWQEDSKLAVMLASQTHGFTLHTGSEDADNAGIAPGAVQSPMPGKIIESFVKNGDEVTEGTPLLILEAMKMEYTLKAPRSGVVEGLEVSVGEQVADGAVLLNIESE